MRNTRTHDEKRKKTKQSDFSRIICRDSFKQIIFEDSDLLVLNGQLCASNRACRFRLPFNVDEGCRIRLTDAEARNIAGDVLGGVDPTTLRQTERSEREAALVRLKDAGLSVRQIQRITGLSLGTISNAGR